MATVFPLGSQVTSSAFVFDQLTVDDGLSHSDATQVVQDSSGYLWIGTNKGLNRYDGFRLRNYFFRVGNEQTLSNNRISKLYLSPEDELWIGTQNGGLNLYDERHDCIVRINERQFPENLRPTASVLSSALVTSIVQDAAGGIWVGTFRKGLFLITRKEDRTFSMIQRFFVGQDQRMLQCNSSANISGNRVLIGTDNGLYLIEDSQPVLIKTPFSYVQAIHCLDNGVVWLVADDRVWLMHEDRRQVVFRPVSKNAPFAETTSLRRDSRGGIWVGGYLGLYYYEPQAIARFERGFEPISADQLHLFGAGSERSGSLNSNRVHDIFEDRFHNIWFATSAGGVNKVDLLAKPFITINRSTRPEWNLPRDYIGTVLSEPERGLLWLGTRDGLAKINIGTNSSVNYLSSTTDAGVTGGEISSLLRSRTGTIWAGTYGLGLQRIDGDNTTGISMLGNGDEPWKNSVIALAEDNYAKLWVATPYLGLLQLDGEGKLLHRFNTHNELFPTDHLVSLHYDTLHSELWAGTQDAGLVRLRITPDTAAIVQHFTYQVDEPHSLAVNYVWPITGGRDGTVWVGTLGGGLHALHLGEDGEYQVERFLDWFPDSDIESILLDEEGRLWLGGDGLVRLGPLVGICCVSMWRTACKVIPSRYPPPTAIRKGCCGSGE